MPFSPRELAVRYIIEAIHTISTYAEYELLVEITFAMANDIGKSHTHTHYGQ